MLEEEKGETSLLQRSAAALLAKKALPTTAVVRQSLQQHYSHYRVPMECHGGFVITWRVKALDHDSSRGVFRTPWSLVSACVQKCSKCALKHVLRTILNMCKAAWRLPVHPQCPPCSRMCLKKAGCLADHTSRPSKGSHRSISTRVQP